MNEPVKTLHITGLWRSGSTILDIIVGSHESAEGVGELRFLPHGWAGGLTCACGEEADLCPFWTAVKARWQDLVGGDETKRLMVLQDRFERTRGFPRLLLEGLLRKSQAFREYGRLLEGLYLAIADVGGKRVIVDSSKYPGRALAVSCIPRLDSRVVHLVRDGRAVIWSWRRKANTDLQGNVLELSPEDVARMTTNSWLRANIYTGFLRAVSRAPSIRVRYEDLVGDPGTQLARIGSLVELDFSAIATTLAEGGELGVGHPVAGNRVRHSKSIRLKPDLEWREKLSEADRRHFWRRAGWLARRYGYSE